jgi:hypothetical protein
VICFRRLGRSFRAAYHNPNGRFPIKRLFAGAGKKARKVSTVLIRLTTNRT